MRSNSRASSPVGVMTIIGVIVAFGLAGAHAEVASVNAIVIQPAELVLNGSRDTQRIQVTGRHGTLLESDLTAQARFESLDPTIASVSAEGLVSPRGQGQTTLVVRYAGHEERARVRVKDFGQAPPVDFRTEVIAALGRGGCNQGACHGSPQGKGGFRLSLRGFDPELDYMALTREAFGRRTDVFNSSESLVLKKATLRHLIKADSDSSGTTRRTNCCRTGSFRGVVRRCRRACQSVSKSCRLDDTSTLRVPRSDS